MQLPVSRNTPNPGLCICPGRPRRSFDFSNPSSAFSLSPGKDARLFVFRLSAVQKGLDGRQTGRSRSDCRENKLEKTKGEAGE